nr:LapA family protein [Rhodobacter sp. SW2]
MMRLLRYAFLAVVAIVLVTVAMANRGPVPVTALPPDIADVLGRNWSLELPLYLVIFAGMVVGLLIGFVLEWFREHKFRSRANAKTREAARLERELSQVRGGTAKPAVQDEVLTLLSGQRKAS